MLRPIKRFRGPAFTAIEWASKPVFLLKGEVGYLLEGGIVVGSKVGPGLWSDLGFSGTDIYDFAEAVTNPIGDASGVLQGEAVANILHKMLNPYQAPAFSSIVNNANGGYSSNPIIEIGALISGPVLLNYSLSHQENLIGLVNISAGGLFNNEGAFAVGTSQLNLSSPLGADNNGVTTYTISLQANHTEGSVVGSTTIKFYPRIMWAVGQTETLANGVEFTNLAESSIVSNQYKRDYSFASNGYTWVAIPNNLSPLNTIFTEVSNPNAPAGYSMEDMGLLSINNGVGTYLYRMYRSSFYLTSPTILRIS